MRKIWLVIKRGLRPTVIGAFIMVLLPSDALTMLVWIAMGVVSWAIGAFIITALKTILHYL